MVKFVLKLEYIIEPVKDTDKMQLLKDLIAGKPTTTMKVISVEINKERTENEHKE